MATFAAGLCAFDKDGAEVARPSSIRGETQKLYFAQVDTYAFQNLACLRFIALSNSQDANEFARNILRTISPYTQWMRAISPGQSVEL